MVLTRFKDELAFGRPEPEERQQSTSESSNADSPSSSRNARSIPRLLVPIRGDGNCQVRPQIPNPAPRRVCVCVCAELGVAAPSVHD